MAACEACGAENGASLVVDLRLKHIEARLDKQDALFEARMNVAERKLDEIRTDRQAISVGMRIVRGIGLLVLGGILFAKSGDASLLKSFFAG